MLLGHLMMGNSKMLRSSIEVKVALIFINLEMDVIVRLLTLMQKKYIPKKDITDKVNPSKDWREWLLESTIIVPTCIYLILEWSILTSC